MKFLTAALLGLSLAAQPAPVARAPMPSYKTLKYPALKEVKIPEVAPFTLANGAKVYLLSNHELPVVSGFALVHTGNLFEPREKAGLSGIVGSVMRTGGTKSKTGDQLNEQLENIAASVESNCWLPSRQTALPSRKEPPRRIARFRVTNSSGMRRSNLIVAPRDIH